MISPQLTDDLACPVCLEPEGCSACRLERRDHGACREHYRSRLGCRCGGPEKVALVRATGGLACPCCGTVYAAEGGFVDLVPQAEVGAGTLYQDDEFQERLEVADNPLLLSAWTKAKRMRSMLRLRPTDVVLDLGCGAGRFALFAGPHAQRIVGLDLASFFLPRAVGEIDLVRGDLRRLPFRKRRFSGAYCLDVLEHLDEAGVCEVLLETRRVLTPGGRLFVYTHAMESSWLAAFQRGVNRLAQRLGRWGLIDHERDRMRKSDHRNAIRSHEHFERLCTEAGLIVRSRRYYNVVFKAVVEDLGLRLFEQLRRRFRRPSKGASLSGSAAPTPRKTRYGRLAVGVGRVLTLVLELDVLLFGRIRTGPFFAVLTPTPPAPVSDGLTSERP